MKKTFTLGNITLALVAQSIGIQPDERGTLREHVAVMVFTPTGEITSFIFTGSERNYKFTLKDALLALLNDGESYAYHPDVWDFLGDFGYTESADLVKKGMEAHAACKVSYKFLIAAGLTDDLISEWREKLDS